MKEEFNLSKLEVGGIYFKHDVKEFIKRLKEEVEHHTILARDKEGNEWREIDMAYPHFVQEIDRIAGDKLI